MYELPAAAGDVMLHRRRGIDLARRLLNTPTAPELCVSRLASAPCRTMVSPQAPGMSANLHIANPMSSAAYLLRDISPIRRCAQSTVRPNDEHRIQTPPLPLRRRRR